jgi:RND family efflux transporter MFP subunit
MKTKITPIPIAVAIVVFIAWKLIDNKATLDRNAELSLTVNTIVPVTVEKPIFARLDRSFSVNGRIVSATEVTITSKTTAIVLKKYARVGDKTLKGTTIAQLENGVIKENLRVAQMDYIKARKDADRFKQMSEKGAASARELEESQMVMRALESRIIDLEDQLSNTTIVSPMDGVIDKDYFEIGTLVSAGAPIAEIIDDKTLKMKISVTEKERAKLNIGDRANVTTEIYPDREFAAIIDTIAPKANELFAYAIELAIADAGDLKPGAYAAARFNFTSDQKSVAVSRKAIVGGLKAPFVFILRGEKAYKTRVQIGEINAEYAEIIDGVGEGDLIVTNGQINLKDGVEVSILNEAALEPRK